MAIVLIGMLYSKADGEKAEVHEHEKKSEVINEAKVSFQEHFRAVVKERKKKSELLFPFIVGFIVTIIIFFMFPYNSVAIRVVLLYALIL